MNRIWCTPGCTPSSYDILNPAMKAGWWGRPFITMGLLELVKAMFFTFIWKIAHPE